MGYRPVWPWGPLGPNGQVDLYGYSPSVLWIGNVRTIHAGSTPSVSHRLPSCVAVVLELLGQVDLRCDDQQSPGSVIGKVSYSGRRPAYPTGYRPVWPLQGHCPHGQEDLSGYSPPVFWIGKFWKVWFGSTPIISHGLPSRVAVIGSLPPQPRKSGWIFSTSLLDR